MVALIRFIQITYAALRYRLDLFIPREQLPRSIRILLSFTLLLPEPKQSRGERLRLFLETLGPVFIKFGQLLSTRPDLIAADLVEELDQLQDNVPPFASDVCQRLIEAALKAPVDELFDDFDSQPLASASIAQVHTATLKGNGKKVIIKVVRPNIEKTIVKDIALMLLMARLVARYSVDGRRLRPVEVVEEYQHTILDELNLQREAANASQLRRHFANSELLYVPEVYWDFTRRNVMVMERIYGIPVTNMDELRAQNTNMKVLAERGVEIFFTQVFTHNFFHADMHPGNIFVSRQNPDSPQYIAVDFAIVGSLSHSDQYYMARNLLAIFRRDYRLVAELHVQSGWIPEDTPIHEFETAIRTVCEPIFEKPLKDISFGHIVLTLFQTARRFDMQVQPQLVLLQKTLLNVEGLGRQLYPELDLWQTAHPFLEQWIQDRFHPKTLWQQLKRYGPEVMEQIPQMPHNLFDTLDQVKQLGELAPELQQAAQKLQTKDSRPKYYRLALGLIAASAAVLTAGPMSAEMTLGSIPAPSWGFGLVALWALLGR
ncbi:MAG: ubiquinone biosynthesis regulatory protein kinase UbiB [Candidatus Pelagadaptatus aseana]|uniref:ubiquinone biosynthesis regulatory protein kinase UbiB n=1 Tax=Candidatus Pelagadaptatus aseana TaxID=3120508 RepID=UPI0039B34C47